MVEGYGEGENPVIDKSEFVMSLFEQLDRGGAHIDTQSSDGIVPIWVNKMFSAISRRIHLLSIAAGIINSRLGDCRVLNWIVLLSFRLGGQCYRVLMKSSAASSFERACDPMNWEYIPRSLRR